MNNPIPHKSTLSAGKYNIDIDEKGCHVFVIGDLGEKGWVCTCADPQTGMAVIEGLILVEQKRFYYPNSQPQVELEKGSPVPPFLKRKDGD